MILYYINGTERSADVEASTLRITNQIQQRTDNASFRVFQGTQPVENQDVKIYATALVESIVSATIVLKNSYQTNVNRFYAGQVIWLSIGESDQEKATILSYDEATRTIVLTAAPTAGVVANDHVGPLIFGGVISGVDDENVGSLSTVEYNVTAVDYTKIFDKKLVADTWEDVDARYILNDFINRTVNYNRTVDDFSYADNTAIQAEWIESVDGSNPTVDSSDYLEDTSSAVLAWTHSAGSALFSATPTGQDYSALTGASTGTPTGGELMCWVKTSNYAQITSLAIRIGSGASDYLSVPITLRDTTDWQYCKTRLPIGTPTGTPDWTNLDYAAVRIVETGSGSIRINGIRVNQTNSFTLFNVQSTPDFDDFRSPQLKPSALVNLLAKTFEYVWYVDYERDIHFAPKETESAPFDITDTSDNFTNLSIEVDSSQLGNRILIRGGEKTSASRYSQVFEGNNTGREWILKSKFNGLEALVDDGGTTLTAEATTSTTTIKVTAHGLSTDDHIVNRTRSNAVRQITVVDANTFTVEAVPSQASGDSISLFATAKTIGVEGLTDETTVQYVGNSNEKSVRSTDIEATLVAGKFIRFEYNERLPIQVQYVDTTSSNALAALGYGDGIFDLDPITDRNIKDTGTALAIAKAKVNEYSNAVIMGGLSTDQEGLSAGQLLHINQTAGRGINENFVIQRVVWQQKGGEFKDYFEMGVQFGTTLFGWIEFMQKLLAIKDSIEVNTDDIVETFVTSGETASTEEVSQVAVGGFNKALGPETAETSDVNTVTATTAPWQWEASVGQSLETRWNLFEWG